ncbi:MAG TPA: carbonic anhydrase [Opitutaceae bacterium]|nr:carbonic anhydrase [Opitutaceae bacterium]
MSTPAILRVPALLLLAATAFALRANPSPGRAVPAEDALRLLLDGNRRFVAGQAVHFQQDALRRHVTAVEGQKPFAVVLTCSDSRVPPELLFDQGIGCLFVVRVAGNVARTDEVATVEYGVGHLGARLVLVLGHTRCGAVTAVVEEAHVGPNLAQLVGPVAPAAARARAANPGLHGAPLVEAAVRANVEQAIADLTRLSPELAHAVELGETRLVGAIYDLETGEVQLLDPAARAPAENPAEWAPRPSPTPHSH